MSEVLDSLHPTLRDLPGTTIMDRYRVDDVLGVGGMGAVFSGRHLGLERNVAIKVLHPDLTRDPEISKRFDREAHSASRLDHPNCLRVTDVGSSDGVKFMVMDLLDGSELADRMGEPMPAERSVLMMLQVLRGLEHAHEKGVVHRDIKPENIFVTRDHEGREILKLVDFGIAKLVGGAGANDRMTKAGLIFGTPAYMSPEQAMGMEADARADLYSVGIILYEMLLGVPPFASQDPVKLVRMQVSKDPPPMPEIVAAPLAAVVMKLLAKDRDERFQSATEARESLELVLPAVASSEVVSGATMLGSSVSGPILVNPALSGPILTTGNPNDPISVPFPHIDPTGGFPRSALPTLPPQAGQLKKSHDRRPLLVGAGAVVLALGIWWIASGDDDAAPAGDGTVAVAGRGGDQSSNPGAASADGDELIVEDSPDIAKLAEVDRLVFANKLDDARKLLQPMLDDYPENGVLSWRLGRILAKSKKRKNKPKALAAYGDAVDADPALLQDHDFYAELHGLLVDPKLREESLDFALRKMGRSGHKFLLELVNDERDPMGYSDRRRALEELSTLDDNDPLVNWQLHRALDLLQATQALSPCAAYSDALDAIATNPDHWYLPRVQRAEMPVAKTSEKLTEEEIADAAECEGLPERRLEVIAELEVLAPDGETDGEIVIDGDEDEGEGDSGGTAAKPKKKKSGGGKSSGCNTPFGIFKKKCK